MKNKIIELFKKPNYKPLNINDLSLLLKTKTSLLQPILEELQNENIVFMTKKARYGLLEHFNMYHGVIQIKDKGYGFIHSDEFNEDFFVARDNIKDAMDKDSVIFTINNKDRIEKTEAYVVKVTKRALTEVIGKIVLVHGKKRFVANNKKSMIFDVSDFDISVVDDIVVFTVTEVVNSSYVIGYISKIIGNANDVGIDVLSIVYKYDFSVEFSPEAINEVKNFADNLNLEKTRRRIITGNIVTIDGDDAKDLDDAISIKTLDNGNFELSVYIADVSYFVKEKSYLDKEAFKRGTSVYLTDRVIPMLPYKISNDLCSLNPHEEKLAIACIMEIDKFGKIISHSIEEVIIVVNYRLTYNIVNKIYDHDLETIFLYQDISNDLLMMRDLANVLTKNRERRGSLEFNITEAKVLVDKTGYPLDISVLNRGDAERVIEEFMVCANEVVASFIYHLELPFIYRVHDEPNTFKIQKYSLMLKDLGYKFNLKKDFKSSHSLQNFLHSIQAEDSILQSLLLRTMAKAKYSEKNIGHYGLGSSCYTHFTAPIRRYPDLIVHRLLRKYLFDGEVDSKTQDEVLTFLLKAAPQASKRERDAIDCEYEVLDMKKAEYMIQYIGKEFEAKISNITSFGLFAALPNTVEGFIHISELNGYYTYDDKKVSLYSKNNIYHIGQKIRVRVKSASKELRQIDFEIIRGKNNGKQKNNFTKQKGKS